MLALYTLALYLAVPFVCLGMLWRSLREPQYRRGFLSRFGFGPALARGSIWIHAASVGEVHAAESLVRALRRRHPDTPVVMTTMTPAGIERVRALFADDVDARLVPFDLPGAVARFLRRTRPRVAVILETELWPNLYRGCGRRRIPIVIASARVSERSARRYRNFAALTRAVFAGDVRVAAQSQGDAERFVAIGSSPARTSVGGNLKYDFALPDGVMGRGAALRARYAPGRPLWVAGSTHAGEEARLLEAHLQVRKTHASAVLALVPRHRDRFRAVADWLAGEKAPFVRRSTGETGTAETSVVLVDTLGELIDFYAAGDVCFVGGTLVPIGGHNLLEPAAVGKPVVVGPHHANAAEVAGALSAAGALEVVPDSAALAHSVGALLDAPSSREQRGAAGLAVIEANRGAVDNVLRLIEPLLAG